MQGYNIVTFPGLPAVLPADGGSCAVTAFFSASASCIGCYKPGAPPVRAWGGAGGYGSQTGAGVAPVTTRENKKGSKNCIYILTFAETCDIVYTNNKRCKKCKVLKMR